VDALGTGVQIHRLRQRKGQVVVTEDAKKRPRPPSRALPAGKLLWRKVSVPTKPPSPNSHVT
jgi:hypothetical protein